MAETEQQVSRLEQVFPQSVMDALIIAAAQRAEHYEMAVYGTVAAWADQLGQPEIADLLRETLEEGKHADALLTGLAKNGANQEAKARGNGPRRDDEELAVAGSNGSRQRSSNGRGGRSSRNRSSSQSNARGSRAGAKRSRR